MKRDEQLYTIFTLSLLCSAYQAHRAKAGNFRAAIGVFYIVYALALNRTCILKQYKSQVQCCDAYDGVNLWKKGIREEGMEKSMKHELQQRNKNDSVPHG